MCRTKYVVLKEMLGNREICYSLYDGKGVLEMTGKQIMEGIKKGEKILGLQIKDDELVLDTEVFFSSNLMEHRHCDNYKPMISNEGYISSNLFYICLGEKLEGKEKHFDCISTRFERISIPEEEFKTFLKLGIVSGGARFDKNGNIETAQLIEKKQDAPEKTVKTEEKKNTVKGEK